MRIYKIYLINQEFASHYFGKEHLFLKLFREFEEATGELQHILARQVDFITLSIDQLKIHQYISQSFKWNIRFKIINGSYYIEMGKRSYARLDFHDRCLILKACGQFDSETEFFEVLRKIESTFIAIDIEHNRCGWLKPIKERKFI